MIIACLLSCTTAKSPVEWPAKWYAQFYTNITTSGSSPLTYGTLYYSQPQGGMGMGFGQGSYQCLVRGISTECQIISNKSGTYRVWGDFGDNCCKESNDVMWAPSWPLDDGPTYQGDSVDGAPFYSPMSKFTFSKIPNEYYETSDPQLPYILTFPGHDGLMDLHFNPVTMMIYGNENFEPEFITVPSGCKPSC